MLPSIASILTTCMKILIRIRFGPIAGGSGSPEFTACGVHQAYPFSEEDDEFEIVARIRNNEHRSIRPNELELRDL